MNYFLFETIKFVLLLFISIRLLSVNFIKKKWVLFLIPLILGFYFQFLVRVVQVNSFSQLKYYLTGAWIATADSAISGLLLIYFFRFLSYKKLSKLKIALYSISLSLVFYIIITTAIQQLEEVAVWGKEWNRFYGIFKDTVYRFSQHLFISCLYLGYVFYNDTIRAEVALRESKYSLTEMQLKLLQHQIDPHFLFNNLNVLAALIPETEKKAHTYINHLAALYRFLIRNKDVGFILLKDEFQFIKSYIYLLKERFGDIYLFDISFKNETDINSLFIPTMVLQELVMNSVKHNEADIDNPLSVLIDVADDYVKISNEMRKGNQYQYKNGTGLKNIQSRVEILTGKSMIIKIQDNTFCVSIPLIKSV